MSRSSGFVLSGVLVSCMASVGYAQFPAAGQDNISTSGLFKFVLLDGTVATFTLGPNATVIGRSGPHAEGAAADMGAVIDNAGFTMPGSGIAPDPPLLLADWPEGDAARREVHNEILDMALTGGGVTLRVGQSFWNSVMATQAFLYGNSFGEVASNDPAGTVANDFPAQGIFNVCAEFEHPVQGKLYNRLPMIVRKTTLLGFPPSISTSATTYLHDPSFMGATFFTSTGIPVGKLLSAGHGATTVPTGTPDMLPPLSCPVSFTVSFDSVGLANGLPNQVNVDATGADPRLDVTVYVSRSGGGPGGARPGLPDGSNALSGSFTGVGVGPFPDFAGADAITSFSYGRDGTVPLVQVYGKRIGNIYFSLDRASPPSAGVCFGAASVGANVFASITPPFGSYVDVIQAPAIPGTHVLVVDSNELGLAPAFGGAVDDEVTGLELKDEIQLNPADLFWFGTLAAAGPANGTLGGDAATIYVYDPATGPFETGNLGIYAVPADMGLLPTDTIDALVLSDTEAGHTPFVVPTPDGILQPNAADEALFSLGRLSPTLVAIGASPADIFYTDFDGTFSLFIPAAAMGLDPALDNIDAADVKPNPKDKEQPPIDNIPAVSEWGLMTMALLMLVAGTIAVGRARRRITPA